MSRTSRGEHDSELYDIDDNTATRMIFREGKPNWTHNDLAAAHERGEYENKHEGWRGRYNATSHSSISSMAEDIGLRRTGMLCVDSLTGKFDAQCELKLDKISYRLGFLLLHNYALDRIRDQLLKEAETRKSLSTGSGSA